MFLAGDIGGTKTALSLFSADGGPRESARKAVFRSRDYASLEEIVTHFLADAIAQSAGDRTRATDDVNVTSAAFGVAGPVIDHEAKITNLAWTVTRQALGDLLQLDSHRVQLLNDLEATANAVPQLLPEDVQTLHGGRPVAHAPIAVIAPGTGLGQAYLTWDGTQYRPHASEGGHVDFAPCNQLQLDLLNYLYQTYDHVSFERVVSGQGIPSIYQFLRDTGRAVEPATLAMELTRADDPTPVIMSRTAEFPICQQTLDVFVEILGAKAGNVALSLMSRGGIFLGGGIPPRILPALRDPRFLKPFFSKGRFSAMMAQIPLHVITNPETALLGAACAAMAQA